jgi:predicted nucleic acid-binding protein
MKILVDTSALLALGNPSDGEHAAARACFKAHSADHFVVSDYVVDETLTRWITSGRGGVGFRFIDAMLRSPRYELLYVGQSAFERALDKARKFVDQRLSVTDCTNVVLMEEHKLDAIFAFDDGYRHVGLEVIPRR